MKMMKNTMKSLVAVFTMALAFVVTGITAEAYGVNQTAATPNSATVAWDAATSTSTKGWILYVDGQQIQLPVTTTMYTIEGLAQGTAHTVELVEIYQYDEKSEVKYNPQGANVARTTPSKVATTKVIWNKTDYIELYAQDANIFSLNGQSYLYADGFSIEVKDVKGKTRKTFDSYNSSSYGGAYEFFKAPGSLKNKGMQYVVTPYITLDTGEKVYGESVTKVAIPQAKISKLKSVSGNQIKVTWKKVSGAKSYTIYRTTNSGKSFKKVKTVSSKTTSYTLKRSYLDSSSNKNGIVIVAKVKVGKKKYNSTKSYYTYTY